MFMQNFRNSLLLTAAAAMAIAGLAGTASATIVYQDNFQGGSSSSPAPLNGSMPSPTDTGSATWTAPSFFNTDGTSLVASATSSGGVAHLPLTVAYGDGQTTSLTVTLAPTISTSWLADGFATGTTFASTAWVLYEANGAGNVHNTSSPTGVTAFNYTNGPAVTFTTTLNDNTGAFSVTGVANGSSTTQTLASGTLSQAQISSITGVNLVKEGNAGGTYTGFTVSQSAVPEPATLGVFALGSMGLLLIGRKRRTQN